MSQSVAGDFVKSLREDITKKKDRIKNKRNLLQDSLNFIIEFLSKSGDAEIRSIRNFEINEIATYFDVHIPEDLLETFSKILDANGIKYLSSKLQDYKCVFIIDLEDRIVSSGSEHNYFSLEVYSKRLKTYKIRISPCQDNLAYSVFDSSYHEVKFWYTHNNSIHIGKISLRGIDRSKNKIKFKDVSDVFDCTLFLSDSGQFESLDLFHKKRKKTKEESYNTLKVNSNE